jgi:predicted nucleic acid-binding protein
MIPKIFLDTNVILDDLLVRTPFDIEANRFFEEAESGNIELYASSLTFCNVAYVIRKIKSATDIPIILGDLMEAMTVVSIDAIVIEKAIKSGYKDFEDAVQYQAALNYFGLTHFVTRNKKDFTETLLPILTPTEYWAI